MEAPTSSSSLLGWIPIIWTRALFRGPSSAETAPPRWWALVLLVVLPGLLLYPSLSYRLLEPDEGRYAEIPREMLERGEWIVPYLNGEPYLDKPPLVYWGVMLSYRALGVRDWSARLIPAVALHGSVLLIYLLGRRSLGERAAFLGAALLSLAPGFMAMGRLLTLDGLLTLCVTASVLSAFEAVRGERFRWGWWAAAGVACGLGILTKGPVALLLLVPPIWLYGRLTQRSGPGWRAWFGLLFISLGVALPWYVGVCVRMPEFAQYFLWEHNVMRFLAPFDHLQPVWYYGPVLLVGLLPGSLLVFPFLKFLLWGGQRPAGSREVGFMTLAAGWCVLFFTLSGCKLPTYVLPAFPMICLALGWYLATSAWRGAWWVRGGGIFAYVFLALVNHAALPWYASYRSPMRQADEMARYCADPNEVIVCHPRPCDSVAFYLRRDDLHEFRSKEMHLLIPSLLERKRTVVLFTHRHSLQGFKDSLPSSLHVVDEKHWGLPPVPGLPESMEKHAIDGMGETAHGLCDLVVVERVER
jgi:4-amino-4-deoxy-L-arabinose transferase-like glycosyltransferase